MDKKVGYRDILRQTEYMKTIIAGLINRFGDSIDCIAFTWLVYQVTQSAAWSAIIFGVNKIPTIFLQPFAGAAIERKNKKIIMILTDIIRGVCVGFIATAMLFGFINQWFLVVTTLLISCAEAFRGPASTALLPKLLKKEYYEFGISLNSSILSVMELIGMGVAGVIIGAFGISTAIYIDAITFFLSAIIIFTLRVQEDISKKSKIEIKAYLNNLKAGFVYIKDRKVLKFMVVLAVFLNAILVPINSLEGPLVSEVLHSNERMLSVLGITMTVGMFLGSFLYPYISQKISMHLLVNIGAYSIAFYFISLVLTGKYLESLLGIYLVVGVISIIFGFSISLIISVTGVEFVKNVEEEYMARVGALYSAVCVAAIPIMSFIISIFAKYLATDVLFIVAGIAGIIVPTVLCTKRRMNPFIYKEDNKEEDGEQNDTIFESC